MAKRGKAARNARLTAARHASLVKSGAWSTAPDTTVVRNPCPTCGKNCQLQKAVGVWLLFCPNCAAKAASQIA